MKVICVKIPVKLEACTNARSIINSSSTCNHSLEHHKVFFALRNKHAGKKVFIYSIIRCVVKE